jgi:hypothetical protein
LETQVNRIGKEIGQLSEVQSINHKIPDPGALGTDQEFDWLPAPGAPALIRPGIRMSINPLVDIAAGKLHTKKRAGIGGLIAGGANSRYIELEVAWIKHG